MRLLICRGILSRPTFAGDVHGGAARQTFVGRRHALGMTHGNSRDTIHERHLLVAASAAILALAAACAPAAPTAEVAETPPPPVVADPNETSLVMAAEPATLGFNPAAFEKAKADLEAGVAAGKIPGGLFLVAKGGQVVNITAVGTEGPGDADPVTPETIFRVYSMTKPVVSVATMQLVEDGKIGLDDPISKYIPDSPPESAGRQG